MGEFTTIMARDGHEFQAWLAAPARRPRGAVLVIQEIFGVNSHIRAVTDDFAAQGFTAIAPALFDRVRRGIELGYSSTEMQEGAGYRKQIAPEKALLDLAAACAVVKHSGGMHDPRQRMLGRSRGQQVGQRIPVRDVATRYRHVSA